VISVVSQLEMIWACLLRFWAYPWWCLYGNSRSM